MKIKSLPIRPYPWLPLLLNLMNVQKQRQPLLLPTQESLQWLSTSLYINLPFQFNCYSDDISHCFQFSVCVCVKFRFCDCSIEPSCICYDAVNCVHRQHPYFYNQSYLYCDLCPSVVTLLILLSTVCCCLIEKHPENMTSVFLTQKILCETAVDKAQAF